MKHDTSKNLAMVMSMIALLGCMVCIGCGGSVHQIYHHTMHPGEHVRVQVDGRKGTIVQTWKYSDLVSVRFAHPEGKDSFYKIIRFHEFELELINEEEKESSTEESISR